MKLIGELDLLIQVDGSTQVRCKIKYELPLGVAFLLL